MSYIDATIVLTQKNMLLCFRDARSVFFTLSSAFFAMLILLWTQISINNRDGFPPEAIENRNPEVHLLGGIPKCVPYAFDNCYTIAYVPQNSRVVDTLVRKVARRNSIGDEELMGFENDDQLNRFFAANPNRTQGAYIFDQESIRAIRNDGPISFIVAFNETEQYEFPFGSTDYHYRVVLPTMIHEMNSVLMEHVLLRKMDVKLHISVFPHPTYAGGKSSISPWESEDAFGRYGTFLTLGMYFLAFVLFLYKMVIEKERGLRDAMKLAGMSQSQHFLSWIIPYVVFMCVLTLILIAFGKLFNFKIFIVNDFSVYFLTLFTFSLSLVGWTFLVAAFNLSSSCVSIIAFNMYIFGYIIATAALLVYHEDKNGVPDVEDNLLFLRKIFAVLPSTMLAKALHDETVAGLLGTGLTFATAGEYTDVFSVKKCWVWMLGSGVAAFVLAVYLDNVLPSEHGIPLDPFYFCRQEYWRGAKNEKLNRDNANDHEQVESSQDTTSRESEDGVGACQLEMEDPDVRAERDAVARGKLDSAGLVIKNVSKSFGDLAAVDDVSLTVKENTAFALLGHNGAGKSTLLKILATEVTPTTGDAYIFGHSVRNRKSQVRPLIGVCRQFDVIWDNLSGAEHIDLFAALKGMPRDQRDAEVSARLAEVGLTEQRKLFAGSYSGGMQRRLSVALSLTANPKVILLDECTSGADPLIRRELWNVLDKAKKGRVLFLITHSIAEAQRLAGQNCIGIMDQGRLRALGSAIHLKSKFGRGYNLVVVLGRKEDVTTITTALREGCKGTYLHRMSEGGSGKAIATYSLPRVASEADIVRALEALEECGRTIQISDYSLNSASLDDVFRTVSSCGKETDREEAQTSSARDYLVAAKSFFGYCFRVLFRKRPARLFRESRLTLEQ